jgi:hypothetical protein
MTAPSISDLSQIAGPASLYFGWGLVIAGVVGACATLVLVMLPTGWRKVTARVMKAAPSRDGETDANVAYAFGSRRFSGHVTLAKDTFVDDIVTIEYDAFAPKNIRRPSWSKQAAVFYCLPVMWTVVLTGATIIANLPPM